MTVSVTGTSTPRGAQTRSIRLTLAMTLRNDGRDGTAGRPSSCACDIPAQNVPTRAGEARNAVSVAQGRPERLPQRDPPAERALGVLAPQLDDVFGRLAQDDVAGHVLTLGLLVRIGRQRDGAI